MDRRAFLTAAIGTACLPAAAQRSGRVARVGWLDYTSRGENRGVFVQAMGARGWAEGTAFRLEYRGGDGSVERLSKVAAELARLPVDLVVAPGTSEALAASKATTTIPIVISGVDDPVARGLVVSLARPGGNVTGLADGRSELAAKLMSFARELVPQASSIAVLYDSTDAENPPIVAQFELAARALGVTLDAVGVKQPADAEPAMAAMRKRGSRVLVVTPSAILIPRWTSDLALKHGMALASISPHHVFAGGLIAYTDDRNALFERMATFVDRILRGAKPADLPVELPTKFRLIVNMRTAQRLGLAVPQSIQLRADHVIEQ